MLFFDSVFAKEKKEFFVYDSKGKRDPFSFLVTSDGVLLPGARSGMEIKEINLEGIMWDEKGKSVAIVNGKLVKELDTVCGMRILKIDKESVVIKNKDKVFTIMPKKRRGDAK
ncbi:MAG: hypothetical protein DRP78_00660 [Candidatus Omnitrophota bacterium]|nr:MAG: hypothetical protein DRP78_00660 [Candidatus Omnitrophota bacterium]